MKKVVVVGLATDYCVKETALDAVALGFDTTVLLEAVRAVDMQPGDGDRALAAMRQAGHFCERPIPQPALRTDQFQLLQAARGRFQKRGIVGTFTSSTDLRELVTLHLTTLLGSLVLEDRAAGQPIPSAATERAPLPDVRVALSAGIAANGSARVPIAIIEVQNHSPVRFLCAGELGHRQQSAFVSSVKLLMMTGTPFALFPAILTCEGLRRALLIAAGDGELSAYFDARFPADAREGVVFSFLSRFDKFLSDETTKLALFAPTAFDVTSWLESGTTVCNLGGGLRLHRNFWASLLLHEIVRAILSAAAATPNTDALARLAGARPRREREAGPRRRPRGEEPR